MVYSNSGYYLLSGIVEKLFNKDYATLVEEKITGPLKIKNLESTTENTTDIFPSYRYTDRWEPITEFEFSNLIGVGDMVATPRDLNTFLYGLFQHKLLSKESVDFMKPDYTKEELFGPGLMFIPFYDHVYFGHGGTTYGTKSIAAYNEQDKLGLAISISDSGFRTTIFRLVF